MHRAAAIAAFLFLCLACSAAIADGKVFAQVGPDPTIPDQRAFIHFDGSVQTLAIETRFQGEGTDFAWVVPLPALPEISAATSGLFPTLRAVFAPSLADLPAELLSFVLVVLIWLAIALVFFTMRWLRTATALVAFLFVTVVLVALLMPALGKARGGTGPTADVTVHERRLVGNYETSTISSVDPEALVAWLDAHGFAIPAQAAPVIASYVEDGWCFVTTRLIREDPADGEATPHPLVFRFETDRCIYPMRLTGVQDEPILLDLFIFGTGRAEAQHLSIRRCSHIRYWDDKPSGKGDITIRHTALAELARSAPIATRLSGQLTPAQMERDLEIDFHPFRARGESVYSTNAAALMAGIAGTATFLVMAGFMTFRSRGKRSLNASVSWLALPLGAAAITGSCLYLALPRADNITYGRASPMRFIHESIAQDLALMASGGDGSEFAPSLAWAREFAAERYGRYDDFDIIYEDSPGNYIIRLRDGDVEYIRFDQRGAEHITWLFTVDSAAPEDGGGS